jgi:PKD repeat protein
MKAKIILILLLLVIFPGFVKAQTGLNAKIVVDDFPWRDSGGDLIDFEDRFPRADLTRYYVPLPVFFQGWQSEPRDSIVEYEWDFGDGSPKFYGFNAGHVYEEVGTYTVTLTVTDTSGNKATDTIEIETLPREGETIDDAEIGDDSYSGLCQTVEVDCGPWKTADKVFSEMATDRYKPGDSILFNRGQTFDLSVSGINPPAWPSWGYLIGAYGTGPKPIIQWKGPSNEIVIHQYSIGLAHISFVDLDFRWWDHDTGNRAADFFFAQGGGTRNILFLRVDSRDSYSSPFAIGTYLERETGFNTFVVDCTVRNTDIDPELSSGQLYMHGSRFVLLDSYFDLSGNHIAYTAIDKGVISGNTFSRPAFGRTALRIHGFGETGADWNPDFTSNNVQISDNYFHGWVDPETVGRAHNGGGTRYNYNLVHLGPNGDWNQIIHDIAFERNVITNAEGMMNVGTAENVTIRNNVFISNSSYVRYFIDFQEGNKPNKNIKIVGNTLVARNGQYTGNPYEMGAIISVNDNGDVGDIPFDYTNHEDITIMNNIFYVEGDNEGTRFIMTDNIEEILPEITSDSNLFYVSEGSSDGSFFQIGDSHPDVDTAQYLSLDQWRSQTGQDSSSVFADPQFVDILGADGLFSEYGFDADLRLTGSSQARGIGTLLPVDSYTDYEFTRRYLADNLVDVGAYEYLQTTPACGNGVTEAGEACDGADVNSHDCTTVAAGFKSGTLSCGPDCKSYDVSGCVRGNTIQADSCKQADVQAAIESASSGNTVQVPAGSCTWSSTVTIPDSKKIILRGAGKSSTVITAGATALNVGRSGSRVTGFRFQTSGSYTFISVAGRNGWRIDNCRFQYESKADAISPRDTSADNATPVGLIDSCEFINARVAVIGSGQMLNEGYSQHHLWYEPLGLGTNNAVFVENSTFVLTLGNIGNIMDENYGGRYVFRFNEVNDSRLEVHSVQGNNRASRSWEIYNNTFNVVTGETTWGPMFIRGGTGVAFNNVFKDYSSTPSIILDNVRSSRDFSFPPGRCDGSSDWDGNELSNGYPCRDQIGRSIDAWLWTEENPYPPQELYPAYFWDNKHETGDVGITIGNGCDAWIEQDRDYYSDTVTYDQDTGVYSSAYTDDGVRLPPPSHADRRGSTILPSRRHKRGRLRQPG